MTARFVHHEPSYHPRIGAPSRVRWRDHVGGDRIAAGRLRIPGVIAATALTATFLTAAAGSPATVGFDNGVLTITGDAGNNGFTVGSTPAGAITLNGVVLLDGAPTRANVVTIHIDGGAGDDTLIFDESKGALPNGEFVGGEGRNAMIGGSGADTFVSGAGIDRVTGGRGDDTAALGDGSDQFTWNSGDGSDRVDGDAGKDALLVNGTDTDEGFGVGASGAGRATLTVGPPNATVDFAGFEQLKVDTGAGDDVAQVKDLTGTGLVQLRLTFQPSDIDQLYVVGADAGVSGRAFGSPTTGIAIGGMVGVSLVANGVDYLNLYGGTGDDVIDASRVAVGTVTQLVLLGNSSLDGTDRNTLIGSPGVDLMFSGVSGSGDHMDGRDGDDQLQGGPGNDDLVGGAGDDQILGRVGDDQLFGGDGDDQLLGEDDEDELFGGAGNDQLLGGDRDDRIFGEAGDDQLFGGLGDDFLDGGPGNNVIVQ